MMSLTVESINVVIVKVVFKSFFKVVIEYRTELTIIGNSILLKLFKSFELKALLVESSPELFISQFLY